MIDVIAALETIEDYQSFVSVDTLLETAQSLSDDPRFQIRVAGQSLTGTPIHHIVFGEGKGVKALIVGGPHAMEPIGSLTVDALLRLLQAGCTPLVDAGVEWHIIPCIDPDGARLNEGWSQKDFSFDLYMRERFVQAAADQVDQSFPIRHKKLDWTKPSAEGNILKNVIDAVKPDFYFSLHSAWVGGAFFYLNRPLPREIYAEIRNLSEKNGLPIHLRPFFQDVCEKYEDGFVELIKVKKLYDYLEANVPDPLDHIQAGTTSFDYVCDTYPDTLVFLAEIGHGTHPAQRSESVVGPDLRCFMARLDAENKVVAATLLKAWEEVKHLLDKSSPFHAPVEAGFVMPLTRDRIVEGAFPISWLPTRDLLFNDIYARPMTEADRFNAAVVDGGFLLLCYSYQFMRLLRETRHDPMVAAVIDRLETMYEESLAEISALVNLAAFEPFPHSTLARVQLGSGLIALNSILQSSAGRKAAA